LALALRGSHLVERPGPGGATQVDELELTWEGARATVLTVHRARLAAGDLVRIRSLLLDLTQELTRRGRLAPGRLTIPAVTTDVASPAILDRALAEGLALFDRTGTVAVRRPGLLLHVAGTKEFRPPSRARPFAGRGCRIVRCLLDQPTRARTASELAARTETSYAHTFGVLTRLEEEQLVDRASPRSGFRLRDPVGLLRAWMAADTKTALTTEGFFAPVTTEAALARAAAAWREAGQEAVFTLASALTAEERHVSGLPHAVYLPGALEPLTAALQLRRTTPHNFLVLRPEPAAQGAAGGLLLSPRALPHGPGVALPQLIVDLDGFGGRGHEQAEFLLARWAAALPLVEARS